MEGIGWFAYETLKRITQQHPEHQFYFLFDRPYHPSFIFGDNVIPVHIPPPARHPVLWYAWFEIAVPLALKRIKPDLFLSPEGYLTLHANCPMLCVMHDIAYEHFPETVPGLVGRYYRYFFPRYAQKAARVATVSDFSRQDLIKYYHIPSDKIDLVYNGCNEYYHPVSEDNQVSTRNKWADGKPYFVFIGGLYPRKNIKNLMLAFNQFRQQNGKDFKLLLIGKKAYQAGELEKLVEELEYGKDIHFLGRVDDTTEVNNILASAFAMTYVSLFEGFGIPCLEAMRCGTAVITSDNSSLPEVCGDAALYVKDPTSVNEIAEKLAEMAETPGLRERLIEAGYKQASKFSWQNSAELLWASMMKVAGKDV